MKSLVAALLSVAILSGCQLAPGSVGTKDIVNSDPSLGVIRGVLKDAQGKPAAKVQVRAYKGREVESNSYRVASYRVAASEVTSAQAVTGDDGSFVIANAPTGTVTVEAVQSDSQKAIAMDVQVVPGASVEMNSFSLAETGAISGKVYSEKSGVDLFGADVFIPGTSFTAKADEDGNFSIVYLPQGKYRLAASVPGLGRKILEGVAVESGKTTSSVELRIAYGVTIFGKVTMVEKDKGHDMTTVHVEMFEVENDGRYKASSPRYTYAKADGTYSFSGIGEGYYRIRFYTTITMTGGIYGSGHPWTVTPKIYDKDGNHVFAIPARSLVRDYGKTSEVESYQLEIEKPLTADPDQGGSTYYGDAPPPEKSDFE